MPEYLAPGVYVEEVSFRSKSIEGVSTTTTGFVGPARYGPVDLEPDVITSLAEFERVYGDGLRLNFSDAPEMDNYLWHAARAFFTEGGRRLYVARVFEPKSGDAKKGVASASIPDTGGDDSIKISARFPGEAGNLRVRLSVRMSQNVLGGGAGSATVNGLQENDVVWLGDVTSPISSPPGVGSLFLAHYDQAEQTWRFRASKTDSSGDMRLNSATSSLALDPARGDSLRIVTVTVTVAMSDGTTQVWENLPLDPGHQRAGAPDSLADRFRATPGSLAQARTLPIIIELGQGLNHGLELMNVLLAAKSGLDDALDNPDSTEAQRSVEVMLTGGNDGARPHASLYDGTEDPITNRKTGLKAFEDLEDISIVAAPGSTFGYSDSYKGDALAITSYLIAHAEKMRYRIAVLDSGNALGIAEARALRARYDSKYAAFYYPWVRVLDPITRRELDLPPSGFVSGIYARNDINRGVWKAPANEVVNLAIGFESLLNKSQQDVLNPEGVNCFRFFEGRGFRLWGARTISSDPEWKYVNLRRYFAYLERSIDKGTQWAVFEPNGDALWANVRRTIEDFLLNEWMSGALLGEKPEKAFFVKCDRTTMTQNDLDNGRLICLIGVAPLRPAEFVVLRIGQWTADRKI